MPHFSITRLRLRSPSLLPVFFLENGAIHRQLAQSPGLIEARIYIDAKRVFWTLSTWDSIEAMRAFRDSGAHQVSMPKLMNWCDEAHVAAGQGQAPKDLAAAFALLKETGRASSLKKPSENHATMNVAAPRSRIPPAVIRP